MKLISTLLAALALAISSADAQKTESTAAERDRQPSSSPKRLAIEAAGKSREALIFAPAKSASEPAPLVFVFHGHGGTARHAAWSIGIHQTWPDAIVVYPQGLPTPGHLTDKEGKRSGWQRTSGDQGDRDLAFFDALLAQLKKDYKVDESRIYSTGHSNGGSFTYILWETRRDVFAAFAPSGAAAPRAASKLKPAPALHIAGKEDPLVRYAWQEHTMRAVREVNGCAPDGKPFGEHTTLYPSENGSPFAAFIHDGGHEFPAKATAVIVKFLKEHRRK